MRRVAQVADLAPAVLLADGADEERDAARGGVAAPRRRPRRPTAGCRARRAAARSSSAAPLLAGEPHQGGRADHRDGRAGADGRVPLARRGGRRARGGRSPARAAARGPSGCRSVGLQPARAQPAARRPPRGARRTAGRWPAPGSRRAGAAARRSRRRARRAARCGAARRPARRPPAPSSRRSRRSTDAGRPAPAAAISSAVTRSSTWQNCQRGLAVAHDEQPRRLEVPGQHAVDAGPDHGRRAQHRHLQAGVAARRLSRQPLDLQPVREQAAVGDGAQRGVLVQRHRVVRPARRRPWPTCRARRGGRRAAAAAVSTVCVPRTLRSPARLGVAVEARCRRRGGRWCPPTRAGRPSAGSVTSRTRQVTPRHDPAALVETDDLRHVGPLHEPLREGRTEPVGGAGDGDHRRLAAGRCAESERRARRRLRGNSPGRRSWLAR